MPDVLASVTQFPLPGGGSLDLDIRRGDVVRLTGPNGSGKTSLLRALAGLDSPVQPDAVSRSPAGMAMQDARDTLIGLTVDGEFRLRKLPSARNLPPGHRDVATLSSGECRRVALHVARHQPLLLLDEPTEGLDATGLAQLKQLIHAAREKGAVVLADHGSCLDDVATQSIELGGETTTGWPEILQPSGPTHQIAGAARGPGLHVIAGPNGSGKTTLLRATWKEQDGAAMLPAPGRDALHGESVAAFLADADAAMVRLLVPSDLLTRHPLHLSGGEMQRVALAAILGRRAQLILLDEPEAHLDAAGRQALGQAVALRASQGTCIVAATHDPDVLAAAHTVVRL